MSISWLRDLIALIFVFFGAAFIIAAIISEGSKAGKFTKPFCYIFGFIMIGAGSWLYY